MHVEFEREQLHQALHDGEAQTIAIARDVGRNADLIELIVDVRQLIRRDADARIEHLDTNQRRLVQAAQAHPAFTGVLDGIRDQIPQDLLHQRGIAVHGVVAAFRFRA